MILFNDFKLHYQSVKEETEKAIQRVMTSGWYVLGKEVEAFEKEFAQYLGVKYCVGVASGTEAIALGLMANGIGVNDEVITTNLTAFPTITGIQQTGATPVVVDVLAKDGLIAPSKIEDKINAKTKAIVPVHLFGQSCDMEAIIKIATKYDLKIIEDCAQSAGATYQQKYCGALGDCGAFSFYPTKNLGAYGDGGAISTNDEKIYENLLYLRNYGQTKRYHHEYQGINSRLDEIQAAILRVKLPFLDSWNKRRTFLADRYKSQLKNVEFIVENSYGNSVHHLFVVKSEKRDNLLEYLNNNGVQSLIHYPIPIHKQKAFTFQKDEDLAISEKMADKILSLPIYPELTEEKQDIIIEKINYYE